jgi:tripartite-type tricarboxylate transporter receptor subunit TctC
VAQLPISIFRLPYIQKTSFDPGKDFTYIVHLTGYTFGVVVRADAPWKTFEELLDYAKANPGMVNYGTPGVGTSLHITMEQIAKQWGIKWTQVPFKGGADNMNALLGGHIHATADSTGWGELVNAGKFRLLVTWGAERTKNWPNVPTLKDVGINMVSNSPFGIGGPKGMDPAVVKVLHDAFKKGMEEQSYKDAMLKLDMEPYYLDTADYHAYALQQIGEQKQLVEDLGLRQQ